MDAWETQLEGFDALVSRVPGHGIDVTVYAPGDWSVFDALAKMAGEVMPVVQAKSPIAVQIISEPEHRLRAEAFTTPELMSAAEIADELGVSRQRVHQLRSTAGFPARWQICVEARCGMRQRCAGLRRPGSESPVGRIPGLPSSRTRGRWDRRSAGPVRHLTSGGVSRTQTKSALCCATSATISQKMSRLTSRESMRSLEMSRRRR